MIKKDNVLGSTPPEFIDYISVITPALSEGERVQLDKMHSELKSIARTFKVDTHLLTRDGENPPN